MEEFLSRARQGGSPTAYRFVNSYTVALADRDASYHQVLRGAGVNLPDGRPVAAALRRLAPDQRIEQVRGPSFFERCLDDGRTHGLSHYFLGGSPESLAALVAAVRERFPGIRLAGWDSPPFRPLTDEEVVAQDQAIRSSGADVVWVGLGTPKQDVEAARLLVSTGVTTAAVGAAFDFLAGSKPEAPEWMRTLALEWLFRLASEPRRLWRRYLFGNVGFLRVLLRDRRER